MSEQIKNNLWSIVENSKYYSFGENPFPIFHEILSFYIFDFIIDGKSLDEIEQTNKEYFSKCLDLHKKTRLKCEDTTDEISLLLDNFSKELVNGVGKDQKLLAEIMEFFVEKYVLVEKNSNLCPILSDELESLIYWCAAGEDADIEGMAIFNPFAGVSSFCKKHIDMLENRVDEAIEGGECSTLEEIRARRVAAQENSWYSGLESNETFHLIGELRLLFNNLNNSIDIFKNKNIYHEDSMSADFNDYTGGWSMICTPPMESYKDAKESDAKLVSELINKFILAEGMSCAYIILPKIFCYDSLYKSIRKRIVNTGILGAIVELPQEAFKTESDHILLYLDKYSSNSIAKVIDASSGLQKDKFIWPIFNDIVYAESCEYSKRIEGYIFAQCDYCLLPSVYTDTLDNNTDNKYILNCKTQYLLFEKSRSISDEKRLAHRNISGQLSHMLGTTYHKMFDAISELKYVEGLEETYYMLYDNFEYMRRLINSIDDDFSSQHMNLEEKSINEFLQKYCKAWENYAKKDFFVSLDTKLNDDTTFKIDEVFMKVLLDAVLENANRHGFDGVDIEDPQIQISTSYTVVNNLPCVLISIANNGASFPKDFTIEKYIREGEFGGANGNTGRGGFHIYQITKRHHGYISLSNDDIWNVKINIMIPLEYYEESEIEKFSTYEEEYM
ncbi:MAG: HAMP domain-containing histidine kinase [Bacteroidales bacterium]|nr:HAMP domain-containing histidine kinase [Bacteroidales bacterium]